MKTQMCLVAVYVWFLLHVLLVVVMFLILFLWCTVYIIIINFKIGFRHSCHILGGECEESFELF